MLDFNQVLTNQYFPGIYQQEVGLGLNKMNKIYYLIKYFQHHLFRKKFQKTVSNIPLSTMYLYNPKRLPTLCDITKNLALYQQSFLSKVDINNMNNIEFINDFSNLTDSMNLKVMHGTLFCMGEFIALTCYTGLIYYEVSYQLINS